MSITVLPPTVSRVEEIIALLTKLAAGDLDARLEPSYAGDDLDVVITGLNMLAEELASSIRGERELRATLERKVEDRTRELQAKLETIALQSRTIFELSTPVLRVWDDVLVLPIIGTVDTDRARQLTEDVLAETARIQASTVILDITGLPVMDSAVVRHISDTAQAVRLLGARAILTGISPTNAQTIVRLAAAFEGVETRATLQDGLKAALRQRAAAPPR
jgi:rsbT co-antagonist protein RsbR